jgi:hypothetical protein
MGPTIPVSGSHVEFAPMRSGTLDLSMLPTDLPCSLRTRKSIYSAKASWNNPYFFM